MRTVLAAALLGLALLAGSCSRTPSTGWADAPAVSGGIRGEAATGVPDNNAAALHCLMNLSRMYGSGLNARDIRRRARQAGLEEAVIQPFLDYIGETRGIDLDKESEKGFGISVGSSGDFTSIFKRFSEVKLPGFGGVVGGIAGTSSGSIRAIAKLLARDLQELLPNGDFSAPPVPTGDALFDRYASEVDTALTGRRGAGLPDSLLAQWEAEFGADPRYWELRWFCAEVSGGQSLPAGIARPADFLRRARERGIARPATLLAIFEDISAQRGKEIEKQNEGKSREERVRSTSLTFTDEQYALLYEAAAMAPDLGWPHYLLASAAQREGRIEAAVQALEAGNACKDAKYPLPFPLDTVARPADPANPPGSVPVCGAVLRAQLTAAQQPDSHALRQFGKQFCSAMVSRQQLEWLAPYYEFLQRQLGDSRLDNTQLQHALDLLLRVPSNDFESADPELVAESISLRFQRILCACELALQIEKSSFLRHSAVLENTSLLAAVVGAERGTAVAVYLDAVAQRHTADRTRDVYADLAGISFEQSASTPELEKYPAMPRLVVQAERKFSRKAVSGVKESAAGLTAH